MAEQWRGLRSLPLIRLGEFPSPVMPLGIGSGGGLWCKRDDLTSPVYGGNKVRKLELLLADALERHCDVVVTAGAAGSNHVLAVAVHAARLELETHAVLTSQPWSEHAERNLRAIVRSAAGVRPVPRVAATGIAMLSLVGTLLAQGRRPYLVVPGGSSPLGVVGHVDAGWELARQIRAGVVPALSTVHVPLGSGGTAAGLALGLAAAEMNTRVVAVRVTPRAVANQGVLTALIAATARMLRAHDPTFPRCALRAASLIHIDGSQLGEGYAKETAAARSAMLLARQHDVSLETTYSAKAFASFLVAARRPVQGARLFWQTFAGKDLPGVAVLPAELASLLAHRPDTLRPESSSSSRAP
ncbi:MAG: pyridoxal-phosphate dependent enzyme [Myxococcota bacterium]